MDATCPYVFHSALVEKPVENVEKSTVSKAQAALFPVFPHFKSYSLLMHKVCFFRFFLNYVAIEFPCFFKEFLLKNSDFRNLA